MVANGNFAMIQVCQMINFKLKYNYKIIFQFINRTIQEEEN